MEYISQSINCFSKLEKQTGIESWTGNKENTTCSVCIPNSKTAYCAICMHSCPYKKEGSIWPSPDTQARDKAYNAEGNTGI